jgi:hypothetical protein
MSLIQSIYLILFGALAHFTYDWYQHRKWRVNNPKSRDTCVWCPHCGNLLTHDPATTYTDDGQVVTYSCSRCRKSIRFLFEAPCPIYLAEGKS